MELESVAHAQTRDIAGIGRDLRLDQDDAKHRLTN
jgi:hypothetical protein